MRFRPIFLIVVFAVFDASYLFAHGGGLDRNGGHNSKNGYHYHRSTYTRPPAEDAESRADSVRTSPPVEPRQLARTEARTNSRTEARTSGKSGRTSSEKADHQWTFNDLEEMQRNEESSTKTSVPRPSFVFFEMKNEADNSIPNYHYVVSLKGDSSKLLKDTPPTETELMEFSKRISNPNADLFFYLNGMGLSKLNWSHITIRDGKASCWTREVPDDEFKQSLVLNLKYEVREWKSKDGNYSVVARYYSRKGEEISLFKENGERIWVKVSNLSDRDIEYLKKNRIL